MTKRFAMRCLAILLCAVLTPHLLGQQDSTILPAESEPDKLLYRYLFGEAQKHFEARREIIAALKTPDDIRKRQKLLKARFLQALGGFPAKSPLNAKVVGQLKGDGFRVEKVIFESRPNHHVTANLYLPLDAGKDGRKVPGVLLPCGHSANGKAAEAYQRACILLAKNGLAALCYDPVGQGERNQLLDKAGRPLIANTSEHTMIGIGALLVGRSTATYRIWDGMRALDYLESREDIDAKRLGCTGNSGGGTLTAYLMALDERIACAAPSCYITSLERLFATIGPQDAEQNITGQVAFGMEHADYLTMRAPRPTLMAVATQDFFDLQGAWTSYREASLIYGKLGFGERVSIFEFEDKHGFSKPRREACMRWLRRWLLDKNDAPVEEACAIFTDAELQCTRSGQVLLDFHGNSCFHLNGQRARELAEEREAWRTKKSKAEFVEEVKRLIGFAPPVRLTQEESDRLLKEFIEDGAVEEGGEATFGRSYFEADPGMKAPAVFVAPGKRGKSLRLYLDAACKKKPLEEWLKGECPVLALHVRGFGETMPGGKPSQHFGADSKEAFLALHLNRPLLGQRAKDVLSAVNFWAQTFEEIHIHAVGAAGPVGLHAALLDPRIKSVTIEKSLVSWQSVLENPLSIDQLINVVPGALQVYDLPDLAAALAPRVLEIRDPVDARGQPITQAALERAYQNCRAAYGKDGALRLRSALSP